MTMPDPLSGFGIIMSSRRISWFMALSSALGSAGPFRWTSLSAIDRRVAAENVGSSF